MAWYLRKSFRVGPFLRLNLSKSGLGASFGVRGARVGVGPRGTYVHAGRQGLYYRKSVSSGVTSPPPASLPAIGEISLAEIDSVDVSKLVDSSSAEILSELNRVSKYVPLKNIVFGIGLVALLVLYPFTQNYWILGGALVVEAALLFMAVRQDRALGTFAIQYDLDEASEALFDKLCLAFDAFASCEACWHIEAEGQNSDVKRHAGASSSVRRTRIYPGRSLPERFVCNLEVPVLRAGLQTLFFFPDRALVYQGKSVGAVPYSDLNAEADAVLFVEAGEVPSDSTVQSQTWQYTNKGGGPDRRFANNRELPILTYGSLHLASASGLRESFQCSRPDSATNLREALRALNSPVPTVG